MKSIQPKIIVAQLGPRGRHYAVPELLQRAGMLRHFFTDAYVGPGNTWEIVPRLAPLLPGAWRPAPLKRLLCRCTDRLPPDKVTAFNLFGLSYALAQRLAGNKEELDKVFIKYGERFCRLVMEKLPTDTDGIYAFEGAAQPLLQSANKFGLTKILEKFSAPQRLDYELVSKEHFLWPEWEKPYPTASAFQERLALEQAEWDAADTIICSSDFVFQGMTSLGVPAEKIHTVHYGVDIRPLNREREPWQGRRPLHILFVGGVTLRKGVPYLYQALKKLRPLEVKARLVGSLSISPSFRRLLGEQVELTGLVTREEVRRHYDWADVFVFPSLCEGSAMVTYEALAAGLPVITTPNAGSVVRDGIDGFIVPIRDAEAIATKLELLYRDPELLEQMAENARARAQEFSWKRYGDRLISTIKKIMSQK